MKQIPNMLAISETFPNFALSSWNGFLVPAATPRPIVSRLAGLVAAAARDPAIVAQLESLGITPNGTTPEEFAAQIAREQPLFDRGRRTETELGRHWGRARRSRDCGLLPSILYRGEGVPPCRDLGRT